MLCPGWRYLRDGCCCRCRTRYNTRVQRGTGDLQRSMGDRRAARAYAVSGGMYDLIICWRRWVTVRLLAGLFLYISAITLRFGRRSSRVLS